MSPALSVQQIRVQLLTTLWSCLSVYVTLGFFEITGSVRNVRQGSLNRIYQTRHVLTVRQTRTPRPTRSSPLTVSAISVIAARTADRSSRVYRENIEVELTLFAMTALLASIMNYMLRQLRETVLPVPNSPIPQTVDPEAPSTAPAMPASPRPKPILTPLGHAMLARRDFTHSYLTPLSVPPVGLEHIQSPRPPAPPTSAKSVQMASTMWTREGPNAYSAPPIPGRIPLPPLRSPRPANPVPHLRATATLESPT